MSAWHNQEFATNGNGMGGLDTKLSFNTRLMVRWISVLTSWHKAEYFTYSGRGAGPMDVSTPGAADEPRLVGSSVMMGTYQKPTAGPIGSTKDRSLRLVRP